MFGLGPCPPSFENAARFTFPPHGYDALRLFPHRNNSRVELAHGASATVARNDLETREIYIVAEWRNRHWLRERVYSLTDEPLRLRPP